MSAGGIRISRVRVNANEAGNQQLTPEGNEESPTLDKRLAVVQPEFATPMTPRRNVIKMVMVVLLVMIGVTILTSCIFLLRGPGRKKAETTLAILGHRDEAGHRVVIFKLQVRPDRRVAVMRSNLVTESGTVISQYGPPEWGQEGDLCGRLYEPGTNVVFSIVEPRERLRRLQLETREFEGGLHLWAWKLKHLWQTKRLSALKEIHPRRASVCIMSGLISPYGGKPSGSATRSQPFSLETNGAPGAAPSRR